MLEGDEQQLIRQWHPPLQQGMADDLVDSVVPADVFTDAHEPVVWPEQGRIIRFSDSRHHGITMTAAQPPTTCVTMA